MDYFRKMTIFSLLNPKTTDFSDHAAIGNGYTKDKNHATMLKGLSEWQINVLFSIEMLDNKSMVRVRATMLARLIHQFPEFDKLELLRMSNYLVKVWCEGAKHTKCPCNGLNKGCTNCYGTGKRPFNVSQMSRTVKISRQKLNKAHYQAIISYVLHELHATHNEATAICYDNHTRLHREVD